MSNATKFRELVSGKRRGPIAGMLRGLLGLVELAYRWAVQRRNREFDTGRREVHRVGVPVVSVGNLTLGGTGKTPMVEWLARWFSDRGMSPAIISRGYKAGLDATNDEAKELEQKLSGIVHLQNPDRVAAARIAVQEFGCRAIVLDDAFQHRRIHRDLDLVLLDALEPFGFEHVFPRGTLREPVAGLARANIAVLTRADMANELERARIHGVVQRHAPQIGWAECRHAPQGLLRHGGGEEPLGALSGKRVAAFCGIGNPTAFRNTLDRLAYNVVAWREFPDHHAYSQTDAQSLAAWARTAHAEALVCTHKDLVKLPHAQLDGIPLWAVRVGMEFITGRETIESALNALLSHPSKNQP